MVHIGRAGAKDGASPVVLKRFSEIAYDEAGLVIDPKKRDFFAQRLGRRLRALEMVNFEAYLDFIDSPSGLKERRQFVESLTTHTTDFFRETRHYDYLIAKGFPALFKSALERGHRVKIWSAACSHGAELYSALMAFDEARASCGASVRVEAIGTDISSAILRKAAQAVYSGSEISGISEERRKKYLLQSKTSPNLFRITSQLRNSCRWTQLNLTVASADMPGGCDIVFLRNVLIYFDTKTQRNIVKSICKRLRPGGLLLTGHSESLTAPPDEIEIMDSAIYRKRTV